MGVNSGCPGRRVGSRTASGCGELRCSLAAKIPGLRRLVLSRLVPDLNGSPPVFDVVVEDWFDDGQALSAASASPGWQAVLADAPNLLDMARLQLLVVEEVPLPARALAAVAG
jgi:uncharacterized protein (TIGR02118 family)